MSILSCHARDTFHRLIEVDIRARRIGKRLCKHHITIHQTLQLPTVKHTSRHLTDDDKRTFRLGNAGSESLTSIRLTVFLRHHCPSLNIRQSLHIEGEERLRDGHVDVHGSRLTTSGEEESLVDKAAAVPSLLVVMRFRQLHGASHEASESVRLRKRLSVELVNPLCRAVGRHHDKRHVLITSLSHGRHHIEQRRTRCHAHHHRTMRGLSNTQSIEARRTLVRDRVARYTVTLIKVMHYRGIATTRAHHSIRHTILYKQSCEKVYVFLVTEHQLINLIS